MTEFVGHVCVDLIVRAFSAWLYHQLFDFYVREEMTFPQEHLGMSRYQKPPLQTEDRSGSRSHRG